MVGRDEVAVDFLPEEQTRTVAGNQMIYMEDLGVQPGDFISYYMTLADNNDLSGAQSVVSDIYFLQVVPTDQEFRRASGGGQQGGGGGGGGGNFEKSGKASALFICSSVIRLYKCFSLTTSLCFIMPFFSICKLQYLASLLYSANCFAVAPSCNVSVESESTVFWLSL